MRRFVLGDVHGAYKAFKQCLNMCSFNMEQDLLISLGDICDRAPESLQSMELLSKIKNKVFIRGNHDQMCLEWAISGIPDRNWLGYGGAETLKSYHKGIPKKHVKLLKSSVYFYTLENMLFVHGGIDPYRKIKKQNPIDFMWDRELVNLALKEMKTGKSGCLSSYDRIFVGHTPTTRFGIKKPIKAMEVIMMDTGAGWGEKLSLMNIDTLELFQSDPVSKLYNF